MLTVYGMELLKNKLDNIEKKLTAIEKSVQQLSESFEHTCDLKVNVEELSEEIIKIMHQKEDQCYFK